jgi:beta-galactosidase
LVNCRAVRQAANIPSWEVAYEPGELTVKGYNNGIEADSYTIKTNTGASNIQASADVTMFGKNTKGLSQVEIQITDKNGNPVFDAE